MITIDEIQASLHSIKISDGTNDMLIDGSGHLSINDGGNSLTIDNAQLITLAGAVAGTEMQVDVVSMPSVIVTATDLDIRDLTHVSDSIKIGDGIDFLAIAADGSIAITDNGGSLTIDGAVSQSGTWNIGTVGSITGSVTVDATDLDIRDLAHTQDSIKIGDGVEFLAINADGSLNVQSAPAGLDTWKTSVVSASTTVGEIAATPLSNRLKVEIQNLGSQDVWLGEDNTVVVGSGIKLPKGSSFEQNWGASANIWAITASGTADLRIAEYAD